MSVGEKGSMSSIPISLSKLTSSSVSTFLLTATQALLVLTFQIEEQVNVSNEISQYLLSRTQSLSAARPKKYYG